MKLYTKINTFLTEAKKQPSTPKTIEINFNSEDWDNYSKKVNDLMKNRNIRYDISKELTLDQEIILSINELNNLVDYLSKFETNTPETDIKYEITPIIENLLKSLPDYINIKGSLDPLSFYGTESWKTSATRIKDILSKILERFKNKEYSSNEYLDKALFSIKDIYKHVNRSLPNF